MKQRTARAATKKFFNNTINKLRNRKKLQKDRLEAQHTALQLRITRFHTTQILNELGIADKTKRADIHKAVQEWKTAQMKKIYLTGGKKENGKKKREK